MNRVIVSNMSCQHCVARIEKALNEAQIEAKVTLADKSVEFDGDRELVVVAIEKAGYTVQ